MLRARGVEVEWDTLPMDDPAVYKLIAEGDAETIRNHPKVKEVYFGSGKSFEKSKVGA
jgi:hypothetical protein